MDKHESLYESGGASNLMNPEQVILLPTRIFDIMTAQYKGFGLDGSERNRVDLEYSQIMLNNLLNDLGSNRLSPGFEYENGTPVDTNLVEFALLPIPAIIDAPNLERSQKASLLTQYPELLLKSGFDKTRYSARVDVDRKIREIRNESPLNAAALRGLRNEVLHSWHKGRVVRMMSTLAVYGFISIHGYPPREVE
jgi:hypothetical protein